MIKSIRIMDDDRLLTTYDASTPMEHIYSDITGNGLTIKGIETDIFDSDVLNIEIGHKYNFPHDIRHQN